MPDLNSRMGLSLHALAFDAFLKLPFVQAQTGDGTPINRWRPPDDMSFSDASHTGKKYADDFVDYLQAHPSEIGSNKLGMIASDIDYTDPAQKGFWIGFFARIESLATRVALRTSKPDV